jgi:hypothetical protein
MLLGGWNKPIVFFNNESGCLFADDISSIDFIQVSSKPIVMGLKEKDGELVAYVNSAGNNNCDDYFEICLSALNRDNYEQFIDFPKYILDKSLFAKFIKEEVRKDKYVVEYNNTEEITYNYNDVITYVENNLDRFIVRIHLPKMYKNKYININISNPIGIITESYKNCCSYIHFFINECFKYNTEYFTKYMEANNKLITDAQKNNRKRIMIFGKRLYTYCIKGPNYKSNPYYFSQKLLTKLIDDSR